MSDFQIFGGAEELLPHFSPTTALGHILAASQPFIGSFSLPNPRMSEWESPSTNGLALQPRWLSECGRSLRMVFVGQLHVIYSVKKDSPSSLLAANWVILWEDVVVCWQPQERTALSLSTLGMCQLPCWTAVIVHWPTTDTEEQTTRTEACFLFACRHAACPPQLCEECQMPGRDLETERSVSPLDYSLWLWITDRVGRGTKDQDDAWCHVTCTGIRMCQRRHQILKGGKQPCKKIRKQETQVCLSWCHVVFQDRNAGQVFYAKGLLGVWLL